MSISAALANAYTGLSANSRAAEIVSANVSNALTEGYGRRTLATSAQVVDGVGRGVQVDGITRASDPRATADRRVADADSAQADVLASASARIATRVGEPGEPGALATRFAEFESALIALGNSPESDVLQADMLVKARSVTEAINQISTENSRIRMDADSAIATQVAKVNSNLQEIQSLNREIQLRTSAGGDSAGLEDQRQRLVDEVNSMIPIRSARRDDGAIALYARGGAVLLDGQSASTLSFTATGIITPDMTLGSGALSGLSYNGNPIAIGQGSGLVEGGTLSAAFAIRDVTAPAVDAQLDAVAEDLIGRFQNTAVDTTLGPTDAGLFTDAGAALGGTYTVGLAGRLQVNAAVDPDQGGSLWRLRDGINAVAPGPVGNDTILRNMADAFSALQTAPAASGVATAQGAAGLAASVSAFLQAQADSDEDRATFAAGQAQVFGDAELSIMGVDTDREMQRLILIEQAYAANARVVEVADSLIRRLLEI